MALTTFKKIKKWNEDRGLFNKGFNHENEVSFICEELIEGSTSLESKKARKYSKWITWLIFKIPGLPSNREEMVDSFADIIVFATGAIYKLGFDVDKVMKEVQLELDDRTGSLIDGKFVKDVKESPYKADFSKCEL